MHRVGRFLDSRVTLDQISTGSIVLSRLTLLNQYHGLRKHRILIHPSNHTTEHSQLTLTFHVVPQPFPLLWWEWEGFLPERCGISHREFKRENTTITNSRPIYQRAFKWQQVPIVFVPLLPGDRTKLYVFEQEVPSVGCILIQVLICQTILPQPFNPSILLGFHYSWWWTGYWARKVSWVPPAEVLALT